MGHMRKLIILLLSTLLTACSSAGGAVSNTAVPPAPPPGGPKTVASDLAVPWGIAFLPGGDALVTERDTARLLRVTPAGKVTELGRIHGVTPDGEGGLMGVAVKGDQLFVYFTAADDNRIVRYRFTGGTV